MASDKQQLEFIIRLSYNIDGLSPALKVYFSEFLSDHFSSALSPDVRRDIENHAASKRFRNDEEIKTASAGFSNEELGWMIAALQVLRDKAHEKDERVVSRSIEKWILKLMTLFGLAESEPFISTAVMTFQEEILTLQNRVTVTVAIAIWPLALDYALRWLFLLYGNTHGWRSNLVIFSVNGLIVPVVILTVAFFTGRHIRRQNQLLLDAYGGNRQIKIKWTISAVNYTWLAFFFGTGAFTSYLVVGDLEFIQLTLLAIFYFLYLRFFRVGKIQENDLMNLMESKVQDTDSLTEDENDEVIIDLETKINSSVSRLEAYVLESALFGALSFSGFLQIISTDLISFHDLELFASAIFNVSKAAIYLDGASFDAAVQALSDKKSLFCLVSLESLICSISFIAVIASRLRFSDISDRVRTAINLAKAYNIKEDALYDLQGESRFMSERLRSLNRKVNSKLRDAAEALGYVNPVMAYMEYFRNAGILMFLIIIITSSLFITSVLGWIFMVLALATWIYFNRDKIVLFFRSFSLNLRITFVGNSTVFIFYALAPALLSFVLKVFFHVQGTLWMIPLSWVLIGVYAFAWMIFVAHIDESFGEIEELPQNVQRESRWKIVRNVFALELLLAAIAVAMKESRVDGANEITMISLLLLGLTMYPVGYYLSKVKWAGIVAGWLMAVAAIGVLFRTLHLAGWKDLLQMSIVAALFFTGFLIWKRKLFHSLLIRIFAVVLVALLYFCSFFVSDIFEFPTLVYDHETFSLSELKTLREIRRRAFFESDKEMMEGVRLCDQYIARYGSRSGYTDLYGQFARSFAHYTGEQVDLLEKDHTSDSTQWLIQLKGSHEFNKIMALFGYTFVSGVDDLYPEPEILSHLHKNGELIKLLEDYSKAPVPPAEKQKAMHQIDSLRSIPTLNK